MGIYTIGHSTRTLPEFLALLREYGVRRLVDVRRYPGSRRFPHFGREALATAVEAEGIEYVHAAELGGRRSPLPDSPNTAWRSPSFRAYADHMASEEFQAWIERLRVWSAGDDTAIMCAEAVPWHCHRQLIADALVARGVEVIHITGPGAASAHELNPHARVGEGGRVWYPGPGDGGREQAELFG